MTTPDATPNQRLADADDKLIRKIEWALTSDNWMEGTTITDAEWAQIVGALKKHAIWLRLNALRSRPTTLSATVPGVSREAIARVICKDGSFCCQNEEAFCHAEEWCGDAADAVLALLTPAPAVTQHEPEAAPTREEVMRSGKAIPVTKEEADERERSGLHVEWAEGVGLHYFPSYDPPPAPGGASVEALREILAHMIERADNGVSASPDRLIKLLTCRTERDAIDWAAEQILTIALAHQADVEQMQRAFEVDRDAEVLRHHHRAVDFMERAIVAEAKLVTLEAELEGAARLTNIVNDALVALRERAEAAEARLADATRLLERIIAPTFNERPRLKELTAFLSRRDETEEASRG